jgi:hypothetical protein
MAETKRMTAEQVVSSWGTQIRASCCSGVFVEKSTEAVASPDLVGRIRADDV